MQTIEEAAARAEKLLSSIAPGVLCVAQEWDDRVDCIVKLQDGTVAGEMIPFAELTDERVRATGERLRLRIEGTQVQLVNELRAPIRLAPKPEA